MQLDSHSIRKRKWVVTLIRIMVQFYQWAHFAWQDWYFCTLLQFPAGVCICLLLSPSFVFFSPSIRIKRCLYFMCVHSCGHVPWSSERTMGRLNKGVWTVLQLRSLRLTNVGVLSSPCKVSALCGLALWASLAWPS